MKRLLFWAAVVLASLWVLSECMSFVDRARNAMHMSALVVPAIKGRA